MSPHRHVATGIVETLEEIETDIDAQKPAGSHLKGAEQDEDPVEDRDQRVGKAEPVGTQYSVYRSTGTDGRDQ